jgi:carboxyl-terminal processing protease
MTNVRRLVSFLKNKTIFLLCIVILVSNLLTFQVTTEINKRRADTPPSSSLGDETINSGREGLAAFYEILDILSERHLEEITYEELIQAAIEGMINTLDDPQTTFMDVSHWQDFLNLNKGTFTGIGIEIMSVDEYVTVYAPIKGTPGERAGLLAGDLIIEVDGQDITGFSTFEAVQLIRGPEGTDVTLKILRDNEPLTLTITRESIQVPSVYNDMLPEKIGYIEVTNFDQNTGEEFIIALMELENKGLEGLILDLRGNPGGLLDEAVKVGQALLPAGPITYVVDREGRKINTYYSYGTAKPYPIVLLVNGASASASEIIAGAFQDSNAGILVGTKTFGKATIQHMEELADKTGLKYTVAKYLTPKERDINGVGLEPDFLVELPQAHMYRYTLTLDLQRGDENYNVRYLQRILNILEYGVSVSGIFDGPTENAVSAFQAELGLPVTGRVDQYTRNKLQQEMDSALEKMDTQKQKAMEIIREKISGERIGWNTVH